MRRIMQSSRAAGLEPQLEVCAIQMKRPAANPGTLGKTRRHLSWGQGSFPEAKPSFPEAGPALERSPIVAKSRMRGHQATVFPQGRAYIGGAGSPAMEINGRRNKPIGPGGSTRRLHPSPPEPSSWAGGFRRGRNRIDEGVKGVLFPGIVPPLSGYCNSCQRQLCSGCSGCVTQFERPL